MNRHYLKYLYQHKYYVLKACRMLGVSPLQAVLHDWSKLKFDEWFPYRDYFYGCWPTEEDWLKEFHLDYSQKTKEMVKENFDHAWLKHLHRNPHHWQHWLLVNDEDGAYPLRMPHKYVLEMVADWHSFALKENDPWHTVKWYEERRDKIILHEDTRFAVEELVCRVAEV